jgi:hypothetical protein
MSTEALKQVLPHPSRPTDPPLPPGIQLLLVAIAWKTPKGRDWTGPLLQSDIAAITYQGHSTVRRLVLEAINLGALEIAWSKPGHPARYRVNRGDWHIPTDPGELEAALLKMSAAQQTALNLSGTPLEMDADPAQNERSLKEERKKEEEAGRAAFEAHNRELLDRVREKGNIR